MWSAVEDGERGAFPIIEVEGHHAVGEEGMDPIREIWREAEEVEKVDESIPIDVIEEALDVE